MVVPHMLQQTAVSGTLSVTTARVRGTLLRFVASDHQQVDNRLLETKDTVVEPLSGSKFLNNCMSSLSPPYLSHLLSSSSSHYNTCFTSYYLHCQQHFNDIKTFITCM